MNKKISFCVVCMNRLHQLKETLPSNIKDNSNYENLEFVVLDYNSQDGLENWMFENLNEFIKNGKVIYYRTPDPLEFSHSHSKNMAFKLATGDILCNINADHYTGPHFAQYVNDVFSANNKIVITPIDLFKTKRNYSPPTDVMGKVCVKKEDFFRVTGFDENMGNYGFEDCDFINRLELNGLQRHFIEDESFLKYIPHTNEERYSTKKLTDKVYNFYLHYQTPSMSKILFLYKDGTYEAGNLIDNSSSTAENYQYAYKDRDNRYEFSFAQDILEKGFWSETEQFIYLTEIELIKTHINNQEVLHNKNGDSLFYLVVEPVCIKDLLAFIYQYSSRAIMEQNLAEQRVRTNQVYGQGTVYKNFDIENAIRI